MKTQILTRRLALVLSVGLFLLAIATPAPVDAAPFAAKAIPAQAEGLIHLDVEKLRKSNLWQIVRDQLPAEAKAKTEGNLSEQVIESWKKLGEEGLMDVALQMVGSARSITIWAADEDTWAAIIDLPLASTMLAALEKVASLKTSTQGGVTLYHLGDEVVMSVVGSKLIVGQNKEAVVVTAKLHAGKGKSLAGKRLSQLGSSASSGIVMVAGFGGKLMEEFKKQAASKVLQADIRSLLVFAGESKNNFFAQAEADLDSPETAKNLASVASGLMGMLALSNDEPEIQLLTKGLSISAKGPVLQARFEMPVNTLIKMVAEP